MRCCNGAVDATHRHRIVAPDGRIEIIQTDIAKTADDFMYESQPEIKMGRPTDEISDVKMWLQDYLAGGEKPASEILEVGIEGECFAKRTIERAKSHLKIMARQDGRQWFWSVI